MTRTLLALVHGYRWLAAGRNSPCRFFPSCSTYALEALETHGAARGTWLSLRRVVRCRPGGAHGIDLVPPHPTLSSAATPSPERKVH